ncbi:dehydration-induced 19 homolog 4-like protein isoform X2 [Tanacetum coccineum]|uniref:Dehydration-induced 19 homolog 4-like protein isoform X2 n=1 Tax=Tanacetum coccineum TaxID=301880 RepID=A0ABQ4YGD8_9ASTR
MLQQKTSSALEASWKFLFLIIMCLLEKYYAFHFVEEADGDESRPEYLCPFCAEDFDIVGLCCHIDEEHPVQAKNGKELREGNLQSLLGGSSFLIPPSTNTEADPLLSSFMYNNNAETAQDQTPFSTEAMSVVETSNTDFSARSEKQQQGATLSGEDQEEKTRQIKDVEGEGEGERGTVLFISRSSNERKECLLLY